MKPNILLFIFTLLLYSICIKAQDEASLQITHGPYLQHLTDKGVTIVWTTNKDAISWVELAPNDSTHFYLKERPQLYSAEYGFKDVGKLHSIRLEDLSPATKYRYRIYSKEVLKHEGTNVTYGKTVASQVYRQKPLEFNTIDQSKQNLSFLILNDIHGNNQMMETLLNVGDFKTSDFIIFNGDMVNDLRDEDQLFNDFMDTAVRLFAKEKPVYYARGNHETRGNFANAFPRYFKSPTGKLYYLLRYGSICFIVLDCGEDKPDSDIEYSDIVAFNQYRETERKWIEEAVKSKDFVDAKYKVAILHMPPFGGWYGEEDIAQKFIPILNSANIDVLFCGHLHRYIKKEPASNNRFPIIANANNFVVKVVVDKSKLQVRILNLQGSVVDSVTIDPKK